MGSAALWIIGSIIAAAIGGGVAVYTNKKNIEAQEAANAINVGMQEDINKANIANTQAINAQNIENQWKMWNATNEYNLPINQMMRYKDAGLNPNLIYGQSNTTSPVSIPTMQTPNLQPAQVKPVEQNLDGLRRMFEKLGEFPLLKEQFRKEGAEADIAEEKAKQEEINTLIQTTFAYDNAAYQWFRNDIEHKIDVDFSKLLSEDEEGNLSETMQKMIQGRIDEATLPSEKKRLMNAQTKVQTIIEKIKNIDFDNADKFWELKLNAMDIANQLKGIDLDWKEFDKGLEAATGIAKIFLSLIKAFVML